MKLGELKDVPLKTWGKAVLQWVLLTLVLLPAWILAVFPMGLLVAWLVKPATNRFGESVLPHSDKYIAKGSSGTWRFTFSEIPIVKWWCNLEDGQNGEDSGRWSASCKGKEDTFWNRYFWAVRNPFNFYKRTSRRLSCFVDECAITYYGLKNVSDKSLDSPEGGFLCIAKDLVTKKCFYGARYVFFWDNKAWFRLLTTGISNVAGLFDKEIVVRNWLEGRCLNLSMGYKIKPTHAEEVQDEDDKDKASTIRVQIFSKVN